MNDIYLDRKDVPLTLMIAGGHRNGMGALRHGTTWKAGMACATSDRNDHESPQWLADLHGRARRGRRLDTFPVGGMGRPRAMGFPWEVLGDMAGEQLGIDPQDPGS